MITAPIPDRVNSLVASLMMAATVLAMSPTAHAQTGCGGDISGDGRTDAVDLAIVLTSWGTCTPTAAIQGVYPSTGSLSGGTPIAMVGVDLGATASVTIDGIAVPGFSVLSPTAVTATTPAGTLGPKTLVLRNSQGQQIASAAFSYTAPAVPWATVLEHCPNPAVVTDSALRIAIIATGLPWRVQDASTGIEMLLIPPGSFNMGCSPSDLYGCESQENSVHPVTLTRAFYLARYEVTQAQWTAKVGSNPSAFQAPSYPDSANRPVENMSWNMIQGFLANTGLRLPTEAEWEFSCRAGSALAFHSMPKFPIGTNQDAAATNIAWFIANSANQTRPVGTRIANALGLHDMLGNVWEYVEDWYAPGFDASAVTDPAGPATGTTRVRRGGCFADQGTYNLRTSTRGSQTPNWTDVYFGFRVARNP